ncbi:hypothetical protein A3F66_04250 [candidate division TM6 bacterium RIFCSPHIGHO2_12_FULL_32_22]|nr:MAG: hypothetical protein A3F66_04250 [candidate division TM6 bacterium RIFCSPHIGHO2_12_FULL_32_22]
MLLRRARCLLADAFNIISYLIAPPFCASCYVWMLERQVFCIDCELKIKPIVSESIKIRNYDIPILAISDYQEPIKKLILAKLKSNRVAALQLGELIWEKSVIQNLDFDYIVPIPLHWTRAFKRGYNQAGVIAKIISKKSNKPVLNILKRNRNTVFQFQLSRSDRADNVFKVFDVKTELSILDFSRNLRSMVRYNFFSKNHFQTSPKASSDTAPRQSPAKLHAKHGTARSSRVIAKQSYRGMSFGRALLKDLSGKKILIVDDLMTTGATIKAASLELAKLNPENIKAVVACRVV